MNERILKLLTESGYVPVVGYDYANSIIEAWATKFAELIIQDAIAAVQSWKGEPFPFSEDLAADLIREHFGVDR